MRAAGCPNQPWFPQATETKNLLLRPLRSSRPSCYKLRQHVARESIQTMTIARWILSFFAIVLGMSVSAQTPAPKRAPDVPYVPTPQSVVEAMLKLGEVKQGDVLYDLGSGDGRIPVTAAKV